LTEVNGNEINPAKSSKGVPSVQEQTLKKAAIFASQIL